MAGRGNRLGNEALLRDHLSTAPTPVPTLRPLSAADAASYRDLRLRALAEFPEAFTSSAAEEAATAESWSPRRVAAREGHLLLGAFMGEQLAGTAGLQRKPRAKERHKASLYGMFVAPEHAGRRIGRKLVDAVIDAARHWQGLEQIVLTVTCSNTRARRLYLDAGFITFGIEHRAIKVAGAYFDKEHMVLFLG